MKTLNEVIKAWSICFSDNSRSNCTGCPYADEDGESACFNHDREDALHYLKAFRDSKDALDAERERSIEAYCQWVDAKEKLEAQTSQMMWVDKHFQFEISDNPPLTWSELKAMEWKPVWLTYEDGKGGWVIVGKPFTLFENDEPDAYIYMYYLNNKIEGPKETYGSYWQAYRKELE